MSIRANFTFPPGFMWGCATAAHQVEGDQANDWTQWEATAGHIFGNQPSGRACEWWRGRFLEDFDRAATMRNNAQRISIEWSRVEPSPGVFDEDALGRYREMLVALRERGMLPMVTLHHFTNPMWVAERGGWLSDETPGAFVRFARKVVETLGEHCALWCTINEPIVYATQGYIYGYWLPGEQNLRKARQVILNMLRGHVAAYHAIKSIQPHAKIGYAMHYIGFEPGQPKFLNFASARITDYFANRSFNDALYTGVLRLPGMRPVPVGGAKGALDWLGIQYYSVFRTVFDLKRPSALFLSTRPPTDMPTGPNNWGGIKPAALEQVIARLYKLYGKPMIVTESGVPDPEDTLRPSYLIESVQAMWRAINQNYPVLGFFHWTLVDNFEWAEGYDPRYSFGLYQVDWATQARTPRKSAILYREICANNGLSADIVAEYAPEILDRLYPASVGKTSVKLKPYK
ncbi:MAG: glycoside hydrolase family 1 protein [Anaerolineae bacterium]